MRGSMDRVQVGGILRKESNGLYTPSRAPGAGAEVIHCVPYCFCSGNVRIAGGNEPFGHLYRSTID
jgi:hypothetical protein